MRFRTLTMAAALMMVSTAAFAQCPPGQTLVGGACRVVGGAVGAAGTVAGGAVNAAGNVAGSAVGAAGSVVGGTVGAITGMLPGGDRPLPPGTGGCATGYVLHQGGCFPAR